MQIDQRAIDQAYEDLKRTHGGRKEDYFALLHLEREFRLPRDAALRQVAFGGDDYGVDAFHLDPDRRILFLFQYKWSENASQFKESMERLIADGITRIFGNPTQDELQNPLLIQLQRALEQDGRLVEKVWIRYVFNGEVAEAERSKTLDRLREDLEAKKHVLDDYFRRNVEFLVEFVSARSRSTRPVQKLTRTHAYEVEFRNVSTYPGPDGESLHIGVLPLCELVRMHEEMGQRLFDRNVRSVLSEDEAPNRSIKRSLSQIVLDQTQDPRIFLYNHNGVALYAQKLESSGADRFRITEPRLLNGAQTVSTASRFRSEHARESRFESNIDRFRQVCVLAKVVTGASDAFITSVTINNNRQNPVRPWNLRANDMIQRQLEDWFLEQLRIFYERQENAFENLTDEDLEERQIESRRPIWMVRLAQTLLAAEGEIRNVSKVKEVFENDSTYGKVFSASRLSADPRRIVLCYKIQFRVNKIIQEIRERGERKYSFAHRAKNLLWGLLCQAFLNDDDAGDLAERFGSDMTMEAEFTERVRDLASRRVRPLLSELVRQKRFAEDVAVENYEFLKTNDAFDRCMEIAHQKWGWVVQKLR